MSLHANFDCQLLAPPACPTPHGVRTCVMASTSPMKSVHTPRLYKILSPRVPLKYRIMNLSTPSPCLSPGFWLNQQREFTAAEMCGRLPPEMYGRLPKAYFLGILSIFWISSTVVGASTIDNFRPVSRGGEALRLSSIRKIRQHVSCVLYCTVLDTAECPYPSSLPPAPT